MLSDEKSCDMAGDDRQDLPAATREGGSHTVAAPFSPEAEEPKTAVITRRIRQRGIVSFFRRPKRPE